LGVEVGGESRCEIKEWNLKNKMSGKGRERKGGGGETEEKGRHLRAEGYKTRLGARWHNILRHLFYIMHNE
jgi:hypothetical protein